MRTASIDRLIQEGIVWKADSASRKHAASGADTRSTTAPTSLPISSAFGKVILGQFEPMPDDRAAKTEELAMPKPAATRSPASIPFGVDKIDSALSSDESKTSGLPRKALHLFFYPSKKGAPVPHTIPGILAGNLFATDPSSPYVLWVGEKCWPTPFLLESIQRNIQTQYSSKQASSKQSSFMKDSFISRCLFLNPPSTKLTLWAIDTALHSKGVGAVIVHLDKLSFIASQRFSLAAQRHNAAAFIIQDEKHANTPSAAWSKWRVAPEPNTESGNVTWRLSILKLKGHQPKEVEWTIEEKDGYLKATTDTHTAIERQRNAL